jgi:hypothetical protein
MLHAKSLFMMQSALLIPLPTAHKATLSLCTNATPQLVVQLILTQLVSSTILNLILMALLNGV